MEVINSEHPFLEKRFDGRYQTQSHAEHDCNPSGQVDSWPRVALSP